MIDTALLLVKSLHFVAAMLLWGGACLVLGQTPCAGPARAARGLALLNLAAALGWFVLQSASAGEGLRDALNPQVIRALLTETRFGLIWGPHLVLAAGLALWAWRRPGSTILAALAGLNLGSIGLTGHAVLPGKELGLLHQSLSVVHLLAGGYWLGALAFLPALLRAPDEAWLLRRFSRLGHWAVALVLATGTARAALIQTTRTPPDPGTAWALVLGVKVLAVLAMVALALNNRYRLLPQGAPGLPALRRGTLAEIALSAAVLLLAAALASLSPFAVNP